MSKKIYASECGSPVRDTFKFVYDEKFGCPRSVKSGSIDWQAYIDASKDSTDINLIVQRVSNGNLAPLHVMDGSAVYQDVSKLPNNMQELSKFADSLQTDFNKFPDDIKVLFDNDYQTFVKCTMNGSVNSILSKYAENKINSLNGGNLNENK